MNILFCKPNSMHLQKHVINVQFYVMKETQMVLHYTSFTTTHFFQSTFHQRSSHGSTTRVISFFKSSFLVSMIQIFPLYLTILLLTNM